MTDNGTTALARREPVAVGKGMVLVTPRDYENYARVLVDAGLVEKEGNSEAAENKAIAKAMICLQHGAELGLGPAASIAGLYVVRGRIGMEASLARSLIRRHRDYDYRVGESTDKVCTMQIYHHRDPLRPVVSFTSEDAKKAGLLDGKNKATYSRWMKDMLFHRCTMRAARMHCPDVFLGNCYTKDELYLGEADVVVEPVATLEKAEPLAAPKRSEAALETGFEERLPEPPAAECDPCVWDDTGACEKCGQVQEPPE